MRRSSATKLLLRLVQLLVGGYIIYDVAERFGADGWGAGLSFVLLGALGAALLFAVGWWFDGLPEPEPQNWSEE